MKLLTLLSAGLTGLALAGNPNDGPGEWRTTSVSAYGACPPSDSPTYTVETGFGVPTTAEECLAQNCIWVRAAPPQSPNLGAPEDGATRTSVEGDRDRCCCEGADDDNDDGPQAGGNNRLNYNAAGESKGDNYCPNANDYRDLSLPPSRRHDHCERTDRDSHPGDNWICEYHRDDFGRPQCCCHQRCDNPDAPFQFLTRGGPENAPQGALGFCEESEGCRMQNGACCCPNNPHTCQNPYAADYSSVLTWGTDMSPGDQCTRVEMSLQQHDPESQHECVGGAMANGAWQQLICCCTSEPIVHFTETYDDGQPDESEEPAPQCPPSNPYMIQVAGIGGGGAFNPIGCKSYGSDWGCRWANGIGCCCKTDPDKGKRRRLLRA